MNAVLFLLPAALMLGGSFLFLFLRAAKDGQFDDLDDASERMLREE